MPRNQGHVAFHLSIGNALHFRLDWAIQEDIGFSHFVSVGNMQDIGMADLIDYFAEDPYTDSIILYVESISEARQFMSAARAITQDKPIVVYKAGRFSESAQAAASHTGSICGVDEVYAAAFERAGIVRVFEIDDMFDCAQLLARNRTPSGPRLAIITNAGGPGVVATDSLIARQGELAQLSEQTRLKNWTASCRLIGRMPIRSISRVTLFPIFSAGPLRLSWKTRAWTPCLSF
jgi:acetyltransferase